MQIPFSNGANQFMLDVGLLCKIISKSMVCFSLTVQQASTLVESIIDVQLTYSDDPSDLEDVLRGALDFFEFYERNLQKSCKEAQSKAEPF